MRTTIPRRDTRTARRPEILEIGAVGPLGEMDGTMTNRRDSETTGIPDGIIGIEKQGGVALSDMTSDRL
jgi:hypothetical protein